MPNYSAGQKIRMKEDCGGCKKGEIYELHWGDEEGYSKGFLFAWPKGEKGPGCSCYSKFLFTKTWETLQKGDVLRKEGKRNYIVQGTIGEVIFYVFDDRDREAYFDSITELKEYGYSIVQDEPEQSTIEMTVAEAAEKMGIDPKSLRIRE